ncbi:MAG: aldo/keto reductase [Clostridia bacterium]|nr:aldo/keto reductase [Clostridia bacterium]
MKSINIGKTGMMVSEIALGCMRMAGIPLERAERVIKTALECGINFFDHADIYGGNGRSEEVFAAAANFSEDEREKIFLQTKCAIKPNMYDFSKEHIISSVEDSLRRLKTDYIDLLLLHRPDALAEPDEVNEAFCKLANEGKVRHFGVSNHKPMQIELLDRSLAHHIVVNQLQFGIAHSGMIDNGINVNMKNDPSIDRDGSVLDYCRLKDITIQAWSPFMHGFFEGVFFDSDKYAELSAKLADMAEAKGVGDNALAIAWILRHPAKIQPIVGSMTPERIKTIAAASEVELTREEWYDLYRAAGNRLP